MTFSTLKTTSLSVGDPVSAYAGIVIVQGNIWQNMIAGGGTIVADAVTRPGQVPFMAIMPTNPFSGSGTIFTMNFHVNESV